MKIPIKIIFILFLFLPVLAKSQGQNPPQKVNDRLYEKKMDGDQATSDKTIKPSNPTISIGVNKSKIPTKEKPETNNTYREPTEPIGDNSWFTPSNIINSCLVLITFGLLVATIRIVIITSKTAKRQLRAYVSARLADGEKVFPDENNCLSVPLIIENHGQTPAHSFKSSCFVSVYKEPLQDTFDAPDFKNGSMALLAPGQKLRIYPTLPNPIDNSTVNAIKSKKCVFYVWGYLEYTDIFKDTQTMCFRLYSAGQDFERGELAYCKEGNNAT